jgi:hypothetical protein
MAISRSDPLRSAPALAPAVAPDYAEAPDTHTAVEVEGWTDLGSWRPSGLLEWFAIAQTAVPAMLYLPGNQQSRLAIRAASFLISIAAFWFWYLDRPGRYPVRHPAALWLTVVTMWMFLMVLNPETASLLAGFGQIALYFAVFSPLFWVPAFVDSRRRLIRVLAILLVCNGLNSVVGVLQVYDPATWLPAEFSSSVSRLQIDIATYIGPNGRRIVRPPGLFDTPGAVCGAGAVAALLGLIFAVEKRVGWWKRLIALGLSFAGMAAIYLSHVRSSFIVTLGTMAAYIVMLALQKQKQRLTGFLGLAGGMLVLALSFATFLGGESVQERFMSVFESNPRDFYYETRGQQVETALGTLAVEYPMGAGLARWGMIASYFSVPHTKYLYAEVQPAAWILDGGLPLLALYGLALSSTLLWGVKLVRLLPDPTDRLWASAVVAANVGTLVLVLTFVPFNTQVGLQFWFLEGLLHGAMAYKLYRWA